MDLGYWAWRLRLDLYTSNYEILGHFSNRGSGILATNASKPESPYNYNAISSYLGTNVGMRTRKWGVDTCTEGSGENLLTPCYQGANMTKIASYVGLSNCLGHGILSLHKKLATISYCWQLTLAMLTKSSST